MLLWEEMNGHDVLSVGLLIRKNHRLERSRWLMYYWILQPRNSGCEMIIVQFVFQVKFLHYLCCFKYRICFMTSEQLKISGTPVSTLLSHRVFLNIFFFYSPWWMLNFYSDTECILLHVKLGFSWLFFNFSATTQIDWQCPAKYTHHVNICLNGSS